MGASSWTATPSSPRGRQAAQPPHDGQCSRRATRGISARPRSRSADGVTPTVTAAPLGVSREQFPMPRGAVGPRPHPRRLAATAQVRSITYSALCLGYLLVSSASCLLRFKQSSTCSHSTAASLMRCTGIFLLAAAGRTSAEVIVEECAREVSIPPLHQLQLSPLYSAWHAGTRLSPPPPTPGPGISSPIHMGVETLSRLCAKCQSENVSQADILSESGRCAEHPPTPCPRGR